MFELGKTAIDIFNESDSKEVSRLYSNRYGSESGWEAEDAYLAFLAIMQERSLDNPKEGDRGSSMQGIILELVDETEHGGSIWWNVGVFDYDMYGINEYSASFMPWHIMANLPVYIKADQDAPRESLPSINEIAMELYNDITFYGWESQSEDFHENLKDIVDNLDA